MPSLKKYSLYAALFVIVLFFVSCWNKKNNNVQDSVDVESKLPIKDTLDIIKYKVKKENFGSENLDIDLKNVFMIHVSNNEYKIKILAEAPNRIVAKHNEYYAIFSIYPRDDEHHLLEEKRQKYGFETYSIKIYKNNKGQLSISRFISTKIRVARAITISVLSYKTKRKGMEVVLQHVILPN